MLFRQSLGTKIIKEVSKIFVFEEVESNLLNVKKNVFLYLKTTSLIMGNCRSFD